MSFYAGFYNSVNGDRKYSAQQFGSIFDGVIEPGVFASIGGAFRVTPSGTNAVNVDSGRAWMGREWVLNDGPARFSLGEPDPVLSRYDLLNVYSYATTRDGGLGIRKGAPASSPVKPVVGPNEFAIAYVLRRPGVTQIAQSDIEYMVGKSGGTPFVSGPLNTISSEVFLEQWEDDWRNQTQTQKDEFIAWYQSVRDTLTGDIPAELASDVAVLNAHLPNIEKSRDFNHIFESVGNRRNIFRGKRLGTAPTAAQKSAISNGTFTDLYVGDYWESHGNKWRIADFNYWATSGVYTPIEPHIVVIPDHSLNTTNMNAAASTDGGYAGSLMHTTRVTSASFFSAIQSIFGSANILTHKARLSTSLNDDRTSNYSWFDSVSEVPSVMELTGISLQRWDGNSPPYQLALMRLAPEFIRSGVVSVAGETLNSFWLKDIYSPGNFYTLNAYTFLNPRTANTILGMRPIFGVKG